MNHRLIPHAPTSECWTRWLITLAFVLVFSSPGLSEMPAIESVTVGPHRALYVNGKPFLPIMAWLQNPSNFPLMQKCGMNTVAGYWQGSGGTQNVAEYLELVRKAGFYGVMPFDSRLIGHPALLAYIHDDEPDLPHQESSADVTPGPQMRVNPKAPLWRLVDGDESSWSVLDPLEHAEWTIKLKEPKTIHRVAFWLTLSPGLSMPREIALVGSEGELARFPLEPKRGRQVFELPAPVSSQQFTFRVLSSQAGTQAWGSISEVAGYDAEGTNVFLSPPRLVPRQMPDRVQAVYQRIKAADRSRPVFVTFTGYFHPHFSKWSAEERNALYPAYIAGADVVGFDIYPIYGWNKPEWIHLVYEATKQLTEMSGDRPIYAWIETSKGGQYTGELERQKDVTPQHIRAEVWMALCGGATAIGYFTHIWKPSYHQFGVPEENQLALKEINDQLTRLAPAILSAREPEKLVLAADADVRVAAFLTRHEGWCYVFAVNYDSNLKPTTVRFTLKGLALPDSAAVEVVDENRTLSLTGSVFSDLFEPLAVHIYRVKLVE